MTDDPAKGDGVDQLRDEAATWFARMRGPDAAAHQAAFDRWLARGAVHRAAYNRIAEIFAAGKRLKQGDNQPVVRAPGPVTWAVMAMSALAVVGGAFYWLQPRDGKQGGPTKSDLVQYANNVGGLRRVHLSDGSIVVLDSDTLIGARIMPAVRLILLEHGRARFEVAPSDAPFAVVAGGTKVTAHGTIFDVARTRKDQVDVHLLSGRIDVGSSSEPTDLSSSTTLEPGQSIVVDTTGTRRAPERRDNVDDWTTGARTFRRVPLAEVIREANRYAIEDIVIADPQVARMPVSGTFGVSDSGLLARRLAALFDLTLDRSRDGVVTLSRKRGQKIPSNP